MRKLDIRLKEGEFKNPLTKPLGNARDVFDVFASIKDYASETLLVVYLMNDLTGVYDVHSTGCASMTVVYPHDLFGRAYALRARYLILIHNHPQGIAAPSDDDWEVLKMIEDYAAPMDALSLLDFIIVGERDYWSAFDEVGGGDYSAGDIGGLAEEVRRQY